MSLLLTAGKFERIYFAYKEDKNFRFRLNAPSEKSQESILFYDQVAFVDNLVVVFTVDLALQKKEDLFLRSFNHPNPNLKEIRTDICFHHFLHVPLGMDVVRKRHEWFTSTSEFKQFQAAYSTVCKLENRTFQSVFQSTSQTESGQDNSNENSSEIITDGYYGNFFGKSSFPLLSTPNSIQIPENRPHFVIYQRNSNRRFVDVDYIRKYLSDILVPITSHKNTRNRRKIQDIESLHQSHHHHRHHMNDSRRGDNDTHSIVTENRSKSSLKWEVELVYHDEKSRSPCQLLEIVSSARVFMSTHGFQSLLLLFQPTESLFVELFPHNYYIPAYFGDIQLSLR